MGKIRLSDAIENLREELKRSKNNGQNQDLKFNVNSVEIELEVVAEEEAGSSAKVNWYIFGGSTSSKDKEVSKHKLKINLQVTEFNPNTNSQECLQVSGRSNGGQD